MDKVMEEYEGKVRVVWKHLPLPFHQNAMPAAERGARRRRAGQVLGDARQAVREPAGARSPGAREVRAGAGAQHGQVQGRARREQVRRKTSRPTRRAAASRRAAARRRSSSTASPVGRAAVRGVQGQHRRGAEEGRGAGRQGDAQGEGLRRADEDAKAEVPAAPAAAPGGAAAGAGSGSRHQGLQGRSPATSPSKGPKNAPVQVVVFSDFQCPFCTRVEPTLDPAREGVPGQGPGGVEELPARRSTTTPSRPPRPRWPRSEQGKFWEMHDKLFANQQALDRPSLDKYAQELGPRHGQVQGRLDSEKYKDAGRRPR